MRTDNRKSMTGVVTSNKMEKSIIVLVERRYKHPKYGKYILSSKKYTAHDETNDAKLGDEVEIGETRPMSKNKRWRLLQVVTRAPQKVEVTKKKKSEAKS